MKIQRDNYSIEEFLPWSLDADSVGVEIGDVQDNSEYGDIPLHLSCSVREFWVKIPNTNFEINFRCKAINISIELVDIMMVKGSQIGTPSRPYEVEIEIEETKNTEHDKENNTSVSGEVNFNNNRSSLKGRFGAAFGRKTRENLSQKLKRRSTRTKRNIDYIPHQNWHISAVPNDEINTSSYFCGSIISNIICRMEGLNKKATVFVVTCDPTSIHL